MLLFCYGVFSKNGEAHEMLKGARYLAQGEISADLFGLSVGFLAASEGSGKVIGEIYDVPDSEKDELDNFQGYVPFSEEESIFIRRSYPVKAFKVRNEPEGGFKDVQVYLIRGEALKKFVYEKV